MGAGTFGTIWERGVGILNTIRDTATNTLLAMLGDEVTGQATGDNAEIWQHDGLASRSAKPTRGQPGPQSVILRGGLRDVIIASRDVRGHYIYGQLDYGETCLYAIGENATAQARVLLKKDGSINLYTRAGNTSSGGGMVIQLDAMNDTIRILNSTGNGIIITPTDVRVLTPQSALTLTTSGKCTLAGTGACVVDGSTVCVGQGAAIVPGVNNAIKGPTGIAGTPSTKVFIGA